MEKITVNIDAGGNNKPFRHFYDAVGYANVDFTYTEPFRRMYDYLSSFNGHPRYMRLHSILTAHGRGDYFFLEHNQEYGGLPGSEADMQDVINTVSMDESGNLKYDWSVADRVYDQMLEHNMRPIVETISIPACIRKDAKQRFLPGYFRLWWQLLKAFTGHLEERYGAGEIENWYFEIWNEPDNYKPWVEDSSTFMALYDYMELAIHSVNPRLKVGGPAVKQGDTGMKIYREFLDHCSKGLNYATGKFCTRVDFVSVHCKGGWPNTYCPSMEFMFNPLRDFMRVLKEYPAYENIEFFNDESDIVWEGSQGIRKESWLNFRNTHYFPGFVCKMVDTYCHVAEDEYNINLSVVDSDNCHLQWESFLFSGNRSQFTPLVKYPSADLIKKPAFNGYVLLSRLGDRRLTAECAEAGFGRKYGVLPTVREDALSVMLWNFEDGMEEDVNKRLIGLSFKALPYGGKYKLVHYRIDSRHSSSYGMWNSLGRPETPTAEQVRKIREAEGLEMLEPVRDIDLKADMYLEVEMPMHSVSLLMLLPENMQKPSSGKIRKAAYETGFSGNPQVFLKWEPNAEKDFLYYRIWRKAGSDGEFHLISDNTSINTAVYVDMDVKKGGEYFYSIQAVNASMVCGDLSEETAVEA